jgi:PAS domain S-box-containing protein
MESANFGSAGPVTMSNFPNPAVRDLSISARPADGIASVARLSRLVARATEDDFPRLLTDIAELVRVAVSADLAGVYVLDHITNEIYSVAQSGPPDPVVLPARRKLGDEMAPADILLGNPLPPDEEPGQPVRLSDSLLAFPLSVGQRAIGLLYLHSRRERLEVDEEGVDLLTVLACQAAMLIDRRNQLLDSRRLREWLGAFSEILDAGRMLGSAEDLESLLRRIAERALEISRADFVVLYEYFAERGDVGMPPVLAGTMHDADVLTGKGQVIPHKSSVVFRLLDRETSVFAESAPGDWIDRGLISAEAAADQRSIFQREQVRSSAGVPLFVDRRPVGVLFLNYRRPISFSREFREHFGLFASQAALALSNARLFLRSTRLSRNFETLNEIGRELGTAVTLDIQEIGRRIEEQTRRVIDRPNFALCLCEGSPQDKQLKLAYMRDQYDDPETLAVNLQKGLAAYVCRTGESLLATREDQLRLFKQDEAELVGRPSEVWLGAPLRVRDNIVGVLFVQDYEDETALTEEDRHLLTAIASHAAVVVDNSRLLREAQEQVDELKALLKLSQDLRSGRLTLRELLVSVLDDLCILSSCNGSFLYLLDVGDKERLNVLAASSVYKDLIDESLRFGQGMAGKIAEQRQPLATRFYSDWEEKAPFSTKRSAAVVPNQVCGVPLFWKEELFGVLTLSSTAPRELTERAFQEFTRRAFNVLERFAGPITIAVRNALDSSFLQALIAGGPTAIVAIDRKGRIIEFNEAAGQIFGYEPGSLLGRSVSDLYWGAFPEAQRVGRRVYKEGRLQIEIFGRGSRDERIPLLLSASRLTSAEREVLGSVGVLEDLRLTSLRGRTQELVQAINEINEAEDLDKILGFTVLHAAALMRADAACLFLREGESFLVHWPSAQGPFGGDAEDRARFQDEAVWRLLTQVVKDDSSRPLSVPEPQSPVLRLSEASRSAFLVPISTKTRSLGVLLLESEEAEHFVAHQDLLAVLASQAAVAISRAQLLQQERLTREGLLVSANAIMVGQIATSFIHEAKNALSSSQLTVENLRDELGREPDLKAKRDYTDRLSTVELGIRRINDLARRLQRFTHVGLSPQKGTFYLNEVVTTVLELVEDELRSKKISCDLRLDPSLGKGYGHSIVIDEMQIQQVLINLLLNAVAASYERGRLLIETRHHPAAQRVEFRLTDYGKGISEEERRRLFEPFFTTKEEGVGLGLYISRILVVENHGGSIEISSSLGHGATFSVMLHKSDEIRRKGA